MCCWWLVKEWIDFSEFYVVDISTPFLNIINVLFLFFFNGKQGNQIHTTWARESSLQVTLQNQICKN